MTANEVDLHKENKGKTALAIVSLIKLIIGSGPSAEQGILDMQVAWDIEEWKLTPTAFSLQKKI